MSIRVFYTKAVIFAAIVMTAVMISDALSVYGPTKWGMAILTDSTEYISGNVGPDEIVPYIYRTLDPGESTRLILGDSVCHQMFEGLQQYNDAYAIIPSNGAITISGQYILAHEYLESTQDVTDIYLIVLPDSLIRSYDTTYGYQYAVMPFVLTDTLRLLDEDTIDIMKQTYGDIFLRYRVVKLIDPSGINRKIYLNILRNRTDGYEPEYRYELADKYLRKIDEECMARGVKFHLIPCPVAESRRQLMEELKKEASGSEIIKIAPDFFDRIVYYPDEEAADRTHFSGKYANQMCYNDKIVKILDGEDILDSLILEVE